MNQQEFVLKLIRRRFESLTNIGKRIFDKGWSIISRRSLSAECFLEKYASESLYEYVSLVTYSSLSRHIWKWASRQIADLIVMTQLKIKFESGTLTTPTWSSPMTALKVKKGKGWGTLLHTAKFYHQMI